VLEYDSDGKTKLPCEWNPVRICSVKVNMNSSLPKSGQKIGSLLFAVLAILVVTQSRSGAIEIWIGPSISFTNLDGSDPTQAASQDRITPNIWLVRGGSRGLYNAAAGETGYTQSLSPVGTEWAYGQLANYDSLIYKTWEDWFGGRIGGGPPSTIGKDAVLHILPGDIYLSIKFTSWGIGTGGFSYTRSTQFVPEPLSGLMILAGLGAIRGVQFYRRRRGEKRGA
jgi:hypothetical protein